MKTLTHSTACDQRSSRPGARLGSVSTGLSAYAAAWEGSFGASSAALAANRPMIIGRTKTERTRPPLDPPERSSP